MEKLIYLANLPTNTSAEVFRDEHCAALALELQPLQIARGKLSIAIADDEVEAAAIYRLETQKPLWSLCITAVVDSGNVHSRFLEVLTNAGLGGIEAYLVSESEVLKTADQLPGRTPGSLQVCTFNALADLSQAEIMSRWRGDHTAVAIETQSTTAYRQNQVVLALTENARPCHAIVEEQFPASAMASPEHFFDAVGDAEKLQANQAAMAESCARFIDFESISVIHMSEYRF